MESGLSKADDFVHQGLGLYITWKWEIAGLGINTWLGRVIKHAIDRFINVIMKVVAVFLCIAVSSAFAGESFIMYF